MVSDGGRTSGSPERPVPGSSLEPLTDPGHAQPYESLYRSAGGPSLSHRTTLRHFQPLLSAPEDPEPGDVYRWLYRPEPDPAQPGSAEPDSAGPATADSSRVAAPAVAREPESGFATGPLRFVSADAAPGRPGAARRTLLGLLVVLLLLTAVVAAALVLDPSGLTRRSAPGAQAPRAVPSPAASAGTTTAARASVGPSAAPAPPAGRYTGSVQALPVAGVRVACQAPDSVDAAGRRVRYSPELLTDGDPGTAWRCAGPGRGERVEFTLARGARVAQLGLLNGYAKVDPVTGDNRYGEYRRVRQVRWTFDDGSTVIQDLRDEVESVRPSGSPSGPPGGSP